MLVVRQSGRNQPAVLAAPYHIQSSCQGHFLIGRTDSRKFCLSHKQRIVQGLNNSRCNGIAPVVECFDDLLRRVTSNYN